MLFKFYLHIEELCTIMFDVYAGKPKFLVSFYIGELQLSVIVYARIRAPRIAGQSEILLFLAGVI
jgi:hypothetical protein